MNLSIADKQGDHTHNHGFDMLTNIHVYASTCMLSPNIRTHLVRLTTSELKVMMFSLSDHVLLLVLYFVQPIHTIIEKDEDTHKIQKVINQGMQDNAQNLQNYLLTWDNYREIWEIRKDAFIRRYQRLNPQVSSFDADIARYVCMIKTHFVIMIFSSHILHILTCICICALYTVYQTAIQVFRK